MFKAMRCTRVEKLLPLHVAGDLAGRRARAVANHLATCAECRRSASHYDASRNLLRAATLPPDFDGAFYEEIRNSVLDRIKRDRTLAPPPSFRFASLFDARLAYAASLAFVVLAAALAFQNYSRRADDKAPDKMIANVNRADVNLERPAATPQAVTPDTEQATRGHNMQTATLSKEAVRETMREGSLVAAKPSFPKRRANGGSARDSVRTSFALTKHAPPHGKRNSRAPHVARRNQPSAAELAARGETTTTTAAESEVSRIEIQTSDPNIRIIWLSPKPDAAIAQPLK